MLYPPRLFIKDRVIAVSTGFSFTLLALAWWYTLTHVHQSADLLFLHYSIIFGIDMLGEWWKLWLIPTFGTGLLVCNSLIAYFSYSSAKILSRLICLMTVGLELFMCIGLFLIIGLNI